MKAAEEWNTQSIRKGWRIAEFVKAIREEFRKEAIEAIDCLPLRATHYAGYLIDKRDAIAALEKLGKEEEK